jgi:hypothetical protein
VCIGGTEEKRRATNGLCREGEKTYTRACRLVLQMREVSLSQKAAACQTPKRTKGKPCETDAIRSSMFRKPRTSDLEPSFAPLPCAPVTDVQVIEVLLSRNDFPAACYVTTWNLMMDSRRFKLSG